MKAKSRFGLLHDIGILLEDVSREVRAVACNLHNIRAAYLQDDTSGLDREVLVRMLTESIDKLNNLSN